MNNRKEELLKQIEKLEHERFEISKAYEKIDKEISGLHRELLEINMKD